MIETSLARGDSLVRMKLSLSPLNCAGARLHQSKRGDVPAKFGFPSIHSYQLKPDTP